MQRIASIEIAMDLLGPRGRKRRLSLDYIRWRFIHLGLAVVDEVASSAYTVPGSWYTYKTITCTYTDVWVHMHVQCCNGTLTVPLA